MDTPPVGLDPLQNETHQPNRACDKSTETPQGYFSCCRESADLSSFTHMREMSGACLVHVPHADHRVRSIPPVSEQTCVLKRSGLFAITILTNANVRVVWRRTERGGG